MRYEEDDVYKPYNAGKDYRLWAIIFLVSSILMCLPFFISSPPKTTKEVKIPKCNFMGAVQYIETVIKPNLREPSSYERIEAKTLSKSDSGNQLIAVTYRARNGFSGMSIEQATGWYNPSTCDVHGIQSNSTIL